MRSNSQRNRFTLSVSKGFTLIEVVIAIAILLVVLQLVVGAYARFVRVEREGIGQQEMQEDIRLALQLFNREARTAYGTTYQAIVKPKPGVVFRNQESNCVKYELKDTIVNGVTTGGLWRNDTAGSGLDPTTPCAGATYDPARDRLLTDAKATHITNLEFVAHPAQLHSTDSTRLGEQGFITIHMQVTSPPPATADIITLQSTVTSRQFIPY